MGGGGGGGGGGGFFPNLVKKAAPAPRSEGGSKGFSPVAPVASLIPDTKAGRIAKPLLDPVGAGIQGYQKEGVKGLRRMSPLAGVVEAISPFASEEDAASTPEQQAREEEQVSETQRLSADDQRRRQAYLATKAETPGRSQTTLTSRRKSQKTIGSYQKTGADEAIS